MKNVDHSSPVRDITAWAHTEDQPPLDLFSSIEAYREFVVRWRKLYAEVSNRLRARRSVSRYAEAQRNLAWCLKQGTKASIKPWRAEEAELANAVLKLAPSEDLVALIPARRPKWTPEMLKNIKPDVYSDDATWLIDQRLAGKRWVKAHRPWKVTPISVPQAEK